MRQQGRSGAHRARPALATCGLAAIISSIVLGFGSSPALASAKSHSAGGRPLVSLTLATAGRGTLLTPYYVAQARALFKKYGLAVKQIQLNSPAASTAALVSGQVEVLLTALSVALQIENTGHQLVLPVGVAKNGVTNLVARTGSGISTVKDLVGKKIAITAPNAPPDLNLRALLKAAGVPYSSVTTVPIGTAPASYVAALQHGTVDAAMTFDPITAEVTDMGLGKVMVNMEAGEGPPSIQNQYFFLAVFNKSLAQVHPYLLRRFASAIRDADAFINKPSNRASVVRILERYVPTEAPSVIQESLNAYLAGKPFDPTITKKEFNGTIAFLKEYQGLPASSVLNYSDMVIQKYAPVPRGK